MQTDMEYYFELAGIRIRVHSDDEALLRRPGSLRDFICAPGSWDHSYEVSTVDALHPCSGNVLFRDPAFCVLREHDAVVRYIGSDSPDSTSAYMRICRSVAGTSIQYRRDQLYEGITARMLLNGIGLEHLLVMHRGVILHASFIRWKDRAILFTAPSETGKSTQAQLWCDLRGAELINGDRAAIRVTGEGIFACGIPFSGSSPVHKNVTLPLAAIVYLGQAPQTTISRLRGVRAFRRVWEGCSVNTWNPEDLEKASQTVAEVIAGVPVFYLPCTPDESAVEALQHQLEGAYDL